ncbi:MAG: sulfoxide reductase heme-binding subunit YedZ [Betaproteobacteria bacterium]|jgi:methionine sulfoxide reductase heme-binding subunit|nr:sulfoxide reductase heme-binding subunit YedZ [Betaproteobacteria bacterium]
MSRLAPALLHPWAKPLVFAVALMPFVWLVYGAFTAQLGPNPAETLIRSTGELAIRFLCFTLAITPLRVLTAQPAWMRFRRMLGLFMFFYAALHLLCYSAFDMEFVLDDIVADVIKRPFILVGMLAFALLLPLALTSFNRAIRMLGAVRWKRLHRAVYAVALLAVLHFFWMRAGKNNFGDVALYGGVLGVLLGWRVVHAGLRKRA